MANIPTTLSSTALGVPFFLGRQQDDAFTDLDPRPAANPSPTTTDFSATSSKARPSTIMMRELMGSSLAGSIPSAMKGMVASPRLIKPAEGHLGASVSGRNEALDLGHTLRIGRQQKRERVGNTLSKYPGRTICTWPNCEWIVASRISLKI